MDEKVKSILIKQLKEWEGESITVARLGELRELITKKTGKHKFLPYNNLRKWVREAKQEMRAMSKKKAVTKTVVKSEPAARAQAAQPTAEAATPAMRPKAMISPFADRVYFQNLTYEMGSMRRTLERISKQLDELEAQLNEFSGKDE